LGWSPKTSAATVKIDGELQPKNTIEINQVTLQSGTPVVLTGKGQPGKAVEIQVFHHTTALYKTQTTVNSDGAWSLALPSSEETPTQVKISSDLESSPTEQLISLLTLGSIFTSSIVLAQLFIERILRLLQGVGLLGVTQTKGYVFDSITKEPVPFALLTIESATEYTDTTKRGAAAPLRLFETVVSTVDGFFRTIDLPEGKYKVTVVHPSYSFPLSSSKPWYAKSFDFYQGETITLKKAHALDLICIPMQPKEVKKPEFFYWFHLRVFMSVFSYVLQALRFPMTLLSFILVFFAPSWLNFAFASLYLFTLCFDHLKNLRKHQVSGKVIKKDGAGVSRAIVRIIQSPPEELAGVVLTNHHGMFKKRLSEGQYRLAVQKDGFISAETNGMSWEMLDLKTDHKNLVYTLQDSTQSQ
jgi:hypothetical protein